MSEPFFIVGFSRSGTTLLATLLDNHSRICVTPETRFCRGVLPCGQPDRRLRSHDFIAKRTLDYWRIRDLRVDYESLMHEFRRYASTYRNAFASLLECYRRKSGKPVIGEKSPIHLSYTPMLVNWFPDSLIFCMVRDGRDVVPSMRRAPFTHNNMLRHAAEWAATSRTIARYQREFPNRFMVIKFESLVTDPEKVLTEVCRRLGQRYESTQLQPSMASAVVPDWELAWKSEATRGINPGKIQLWKSGMQPRRLYLLNCIMNEELQRWGYESIGNIGTSAAWRCAGRLASLPFRDGTYRAFRETSDRIRIVLCRLGLKAYK